MRAPWRFIAALLAMVGVTLTNDEVYMTTLQRGQGLAKSMGWAALVLIGLVLAGCKPGPATCNGDFKTLMPVDWKYINQWPLNTDSDKQLDCVVLYRFDAKTKDGQKITPVGGVVYRQDHGRPRWIYPHPLILPDNFYLGENTVAPDVADALSGSEGPELIVRDFDPAGNVVQTSLFSWRDTKIAQPDAEPTTSPDIMSYKAVGLFHGNAGVTVEKDRITVLTRRDNTRSQLATRRVYLPRDKRNYFQQGNFNLVDPAETDIVSLVLGDDPTASPYPEKTVLTFYQVVKDDAQVDKLMTPDAAGNLKANKLLYGCPVGRQDLDRVFVQDLNWNLGTEVQPQVAVTGLCRLRNGTFQAMTPTTWQLEKNAEGRWRLKGATQ